MKLLWSNLDFRRTFECTLSPEWENVLFFRKFAKIGCFRHCIFSFTLLDTPIWAYFLLMIHYETFPHVWGMWSAIMLALMDPSTNACGCSTHRLQHPLQKPRCIPLKSGSLMENVIGVLLGLYMSWTRFYICNINAIMEAFAQIRVIILSAHARAAKCKLKSASKIEVAILKVLLLHINKIIKQNRHKKSSWIWHCLVPARFIEIFEARAVEGS